LTVSCLRSFHKVPQSHQLLLDSPSTEPHTKPKSISCWTSCPWYLQLLSLFYTHSHPHPNQAHLLCWQVLMPV
jgi:hypothetical protein